MYIKRVNGLEVKEMTKLQYFLIELNCLIACKAVNVRLVELHYEDLRTSKRFPEAKNQYTKFFDKVLDHLWSDTYRRKIWTYLIY